MPKVKRFHDPILFENEFESIDLDKHVIGIYYLEHKWDVMDHLSVVEMIGLEGSTGTWVEVPGETPEVRKSLSAKVLGYYPIPSPDPSTRKAFVAYAFPTDQWREPSIPMLLTAIAGNISSLVKLTGLWFPKSYVKGFKGPKFGVEGVRKTLKVKERPLLLSMVKPKIGLTPEATAKQCYDAAIGGTDLIKDDEMMGDSFRSKIEDRLSAVMDALDRAEEETGEKTLYTINVTDEVSKIPEKAEKLIEAGANALMLNFPAGFTALRLLAEDDSINVPILFHPDAAAPYSMGSRWGISFPVISKLVRLSGADIWIIATPWGKFRARTGQEEMYRAGHVLQAPFYHIKRIWPLPGGGMNPGLVPTTIEEFGPDIVIGAGGAIHGHPQGSTAGARAFRQAIDATMQNVPLEEYAKEKPELKVAVDLWGVFQRPTTVLFKGAK